MQSLLFDETTESKRLHSNDGHDGDLGQYFTPQWAADTLVERFIREESPDSLVEPTCGNGRFLNAVPGHLPACGIEIDPKMAEIARIESGRPVLVQPFEKTTRDDLKRLGIDKPNHYIGNLPFSLKLAIRFLDRIYDISDKDATCAFILPSYFFQTCATVKQISRKWGISQEMIPRDLFDDLSKPIVWAVLRKHRGSSGFFLYDEKYAIDALKSDAKRILAEHSQSWRELVRVTLAELGQPVSLQGIYSAMEGANIPETNRFWKEKVRQTLQRYSEFNRVERGIWELRG